MPEKRFYYSTKLSVLSSRSEDCGLCSNCSISERDAFVVVVGRRQSLNYHTFNIKNNSQVELSGRPLDEVDEDPPPLCATWLGLDFNPRHLMAKAGQYATLSPCRITSWKHGYYIRMWQEWVRDVGKGSGKWGRQSCCCCSCCCAHVGVAKRMLCVFWCWWWWLWQHD